LPFLKKYTHILEKPYRWKSWAAPKDKDGKLNHNAAMTGDDLLVFVNQKLFPYLHGFTQKATGPNTIEYKIGQIFGEIKNKISSGYNLREIIDHIDELRFSSHTEKHELSHLYEAKIKNMILHGIEAPNIIHTNTLTENLADIQEKDRFDVVLANPPFGGKERKEVQQNFPIRTGETAFLFLQHFIKILKASGRGGVVIKNTFLSNTDNASVSLRKLLLESCNLYTVLDCPGGTFQGQV
jgi:type I restriction-modification system DNA methylase subunit